VAEITEQEFELTTSNEEIAVRSHDVFVTSGSARATEFEALTNIGAAVRLAINLRGVPPVDFDLLKKVAVHRLGLQPSEVRPAVELLAEAEMVDLYQEGRNIKTVAPQIPYYSDLYTNIGEVGTSEGLNEHEQLTIDVMQRLHKSPVTKDALTALGAERRALDRVIDIGEQAGFVLPKRARGQTIYISPGYFSEDPQALANLTALAGNSRLSRVLTLLGTNQGFPLSKILSDHELAGHALDARELGIIRALAGEGFVPPPAIRTSHSGENHFIFGIRPGGIRLRPHEVQIYRNALALVAAVRQGQFLAKEYAIRYPGAILRTLQERGYLGSNSEAPEQYKGVVQAGIGVLEYTSQGMARLRLIDHPDNKKTLDMAITLVAGSSFHPAPDEELILALRRGEEYVEPLLARKVLSDYRIVDADMETQHAIDRFLLRSTR
jgi:hypothetical protein